MTMSQIILSDTHMDIYRYRHSVWLQYGDGMAKVIGITIRTNGRKRRKIAVTSVTPKTNTWKLEEYKVMQKESVWMI